MKSGIKIITGVWLLVICVLVSCKKSGGGSTPPPSATLPALSGADVTRARTTAAGTMRFYLVLSKASASAVSAKYTLVAGTATTPRDFTAGAGTISIPANETSAFIDVAITGDSLRQADIFFTVQLSDPVNCTIGSPSFKGIISSADGTYLPTDNTGYTTPTTYPGYTMVWSDEFSGNVIDQTNWNFETGGSGWGNHELENYTGRPQNAFQSNGNLIIEARKEDLGGNNYTSARMTTYNKRTFTYGRIDIRAKLPVAKGMWPALWMLGSDIATNPWPKCGEIDIMELIGTNPKQVIGSMHWPLADGSNGTINNAYQLATEDFSQQFHVFSIIWIQNSIQFFVDDQLYFTGTSASISSGTYAFNHPYFFIMNVAVGGDWPGPPDATTVFPQRMFVDYVRVFQ